ncbi:hypothetical protein [Kitasatospora sp. McL0602]|uniref:hypothetical protein n=1 Tax=Kitasatospora sp. McL0602 TaxID=3439530 RepID=UPI003F8AF6E6
MTDLAGRVAVAQAATAAAVAAAFPYLGLGPAIKQRLDEEATEALERTLSLAEGLGSLGLASCEGPRDGARAITVERSASADVQVYCDPIDGTLNAARGGPRSFSVLALSSRAGRQGLALDDSQAIFALGSHQDDVSTAFDSGARWSDVVTEHLRRPERLTATLNRSDNLRLLLELGGWGLDRFTVGSRAGHRPSLRGSGTLAVGDATVTLPFECDLEFGRLGLAEAQIQSALYPNWSGLVVSRDSIRASADGLRGYLDRYLAARSWGDVRRLRSLFTVQELAGFHERGLTLYEVTDTLAAEDFGPGRDAVVSIAALTSPHDTALGTSAAVLNDPLWHAESGRLAVDVLTCAGGRVTRRRHEVAVEDNPVLSARVRAWYQSLHWSDAPADDATGQFLAALAEGRTPPAPSTRG